MLRWRMFLRIELVRTRGCWSWWRHQRETFSASLALCAGNSPVTGEFPHRGQWRGALMFSLICAWINGSVNNREAGDLRRHCAHYDVTVMMAWQSNWLPIARPVSHSTVGIVSVFLFQGWFHSTMETIILFEDWTTSSWQGANHIP